MDNLEDKLNNLEQKIQTVCQLGYNIIKDFKEDYNNHKEDIEKVNNFSQGSMIRNLDNQINNLKIELDIKDNTIMRLKKQILLINTINITEQVPTINITEQVPTINITEQVPTIVTEQVPTINITEQVPTIVTEQVPTIVTEQVPTINITEQVHTIVTEQVPTINITEQVPTNITKQVEMVVIQDNINEEDIEYAEIEYKKKTYYKNNNNKIFIKKKNNSVGKLYGNLVNNKIEKIKKTA
jgi:hypothetical protein